MYNLIIITPDQLRQDYLGCYGHKDAKTTHIDQLSKDGITFDNCYCASPLCGPSRISFATSTYVSEHGHRNYWSTINPDVPNIVGELKKKGYRTGMFGKNHLFTYSRLRDLWDEMDEICLGNYDGHEKYKHAFSSFTLEEDHAYNITGKLTSEGIEFMERRGDTPFFLWMNYQDPHPAFICPTPYDTMYNASDMTLPVTYTDYQAHQQPIRNEVWRKHSEMDDCTAQNLKEAMAHYMGQIKYVDDSVGRITDYLKQSGLEKNTIVLFFSDHGELLGDYNMTHKIPVYYDCLTKIPVIIKHPDATNLSVRIEGLTEEVDLVPTLLDMLGIEAPATMMGQSWWQSIKNGDYHCGRDSILCEAGGGAPTCRKPLPGLTLVAPHVPTSFGPGAMIRKGCYKLSIYFDDRSELFDLSKDSKELHNLFEDKEYESVKQNLTLELLKRILGVKVRDIGTLDWDPNEYPIDVRFEPLEMQGAVVDIRKCN